MPARKFLKVVIKRGLAREDFHMAPQLFHRGLLDNGYGELPIMSQHVVAIESLPAIHKDPFDLILVAQASAEGITLVTSDALLVQHPGPIRIV